MNTPKSLYSSIITTIQNGNYSVKLSLAELAFIEDNPQLFDKVQIAVNSIINANDIEYHDIPEIIALMQEIYKSYFSKHAIENIGIINIIRFTFDSILDSNISLLEPELQIIKKIINSSFTLLSANIECIKKKDDACFSFFNICC